MYVYICSKFIVMKQVAMHYISHSKYMLIFVANVYIVIFQWKSFKKSPVRDFENNILGNKAGI